MALELNSSCRAATPALTGETVNRRLKNLGQAMGLEMASYRGGLNI